MKAIITALILIISISGISQNFDNMKQIVKIHNEKDTSKLIEMGFTQDSTGAYVSDFEKFIFDGNVTYFMASADQFDKNKRVTTNYGWVLTPKTTETVYADFIDSRTGEISEEQGDYFKCAGRHVTKFFFPNEPEFKYVFTIEDTTDFE